MKTRHAEDICTVGDFLTLFKGAEKGAFLCPHCGTNHTDFIKQLPDDGENRSFVCRGCMRRIHVNGGEVNLQVFLKHAKR